MTNLQVVVWSALSYALHGAPGGLPRKVDLPDTWKDTGPWSVSRVGFHRFLRAQELIHLVCAFADLTETAFMHKMHERSSPSLPQHPEFTCS